MDRAKERPGQLCYRPNRGEFYTHHPAPGARMSLQDHALNTEARRLLADEEEAARAKANVSPRTHDGGIWSPIAAFNRRHKVEELLALYGFETQDGINWHHPTIQTSGMSGTKVYSDGGWSTLSEFTPRPLPRTTVLLPRTTARRYEPT